MAAKQQVPNTLLPHPKFERPLFKNGHFFSHTWFAKVQEVLQADWHEV
jgi:hypothetical protein